MKRLFLLITCITLAASAHATQKKVSVSLGPWVQDVTETSFTVMWMSDLDAIGWVEVAPDDGKHFYHEARKTYYDLRGDGVQPICKIHKVKVDGLEPGRRYRYRLMMKGVVEYNSVLDIEFTRTFGSNVYSRNPYVTSTLKESYDTVRFCVVNDIHQKDSILRVLLGDVAAKQDFVAFNGDMLNDMMTETKIPRFYLGSAVDIFASSVPLVNVRGNHEFRGRDAVKWLDYVSTPTGKAYYSFKYGDFFFIVLDCGDDKPDSDIEYSGLMVSEPYMKAQAEWLAGVAASPECRNAARRIVFCHIPPEDKGWKGNQNICDYFVPILNKAGVDLMFSAHTHEYRFDPAGSGMSDAAFPVWVNDNAERLDVVLTRKSLSLKAFNPDGKLTHSMDL